MAQVPTPTTCASCHKPATRWICLRCEEASEYAGTTSTFYCNRFCQMNHTSDHRPECDRRLRIQKLHQAGEVLNTLWPIMRSQNILSKVDNIRTCNGKLEVWTTTSRFQWEYVAPLVNFHRDKRAERAVLDTFELSSMEVVCSMNQLVQDLLKDTCSKIERIRVRPKNRLFRVDYYQREAVPHDRYQLMSGLVAQDLHIGYGHVVLPNDPKPEVHGLFKVRLKGSDEYFAVDIANGGHGRFDTIVPWDTYMTERVAYMISEKAFSSYRELKPPLGESLIRTIDLIEFNTYHMQYVVKSWLESRNFTCNMLVTQKKSVFAQNLVSLQEYTSARLRESFETACKCGDLLMRSRQFHSNHGRRREIQQQRRRCMEQAGIWEAVGNTARPFSSW